MNVNTKLIEKFIAENGYTFKEFTAKSGISISAFSRMMNRQVCSRLRTIGKVAVFMGIDYETLLKQNGAAKS